MVNISFQSAGWLAERRFTFHGRRDLLLLLTLNESSKPLERLLLRLRLRLLLLLHRSVNYMLPILAPLHLEQHTHSHTIRQPTANQGERDKQIKSGGTKSNSPPRLPTPVDMMQVKIY